jgi:hypothetical protein
MHLLSGRISVSHHGFACSLNTINYRGWFLFQAVFIYSSHGEVGRKKVLKAFLKILHLYLEICEACTTCAHVRLHIFPGSAFTPRFMWRNSTSRLVALSRNAVMLIATAEYSRPCRHSRGRLNCWPIRNYVLKYGSVFSSCTWVYIFALRLRTGNT